MNCLCCGKPLRPDEEKSGWHHRCIKRFFGTDELPEIKINNEVLQELADAGIQKGYTIPGVQKKLSLHLSKYPTARLTLVDYPNGYILKPQTEDYPSLLEAEQLVMNMADQAGIKTVPHALINNGQELAYITKRIDRIIKTKTVTKLAMEDFCQLDQRLTIDKYHGSYEQCGKVIEKYSSQIGIDLTEFYLRIVFSYLVGNSDMHLKNFSLIERIPNSKDFCLSAAYDLLPVKIVLPEDKEDLALPLKGKKRNLRRNDFLYFAQECNISLSVANRMINKLLANKAKFEVMVNESFLSEDLKKSFIRLLGQRFDNLSQGNKQNDED